MKQSTFFLSILLAVLIFTSTGFAQGPKIGYVNSAKILQEYPEAIEANKKIEAMGKQWQSELERMSRDLQSKYEDFQKKEPLLKEDEKRTQREELVMLEQKGIQFRQDKFGNDGELAIVSDSLLRPIKQKVMNVIATVAKDEKIQFMFDRNEQIMFLLYGDAKFDYTNLVIDRLKRGKN
ncbi:MAG: OmpH family outer membrane protein [Ignavibacteriales bacterium]|nr:OmpH family outer membrane protein [Ignavibacteriales bacterium]